MKHHPISRRRSSGLLTALLLAATITGCSDDPPAAQAAVSDVRPAVAGQTGTPSQRPGPLPPPPLASLSPVPPAGTVRQGPGPFDDRFTMTPQLEPTGAAADITVTSDVSELIVLELQADFYDGAGLLLGTAKTTHQEKHGDGEDHADSDDGVHLTVTAEPAYRGRVASAVVSVPVLVNE